MGEAANLVFVVVMLALQAAALFAFAWVPLLALWAGVMSWPAAVGFALAINALALALLYD